jgi:hypothetical protein
MPPLGTTVFDICASPLVGKVMRLTSCADVKVFRTVKLAATYAIGTILKFVGECTCWRVESYYSNYVDNPTVDLTFADCTLCLELVTSQLCTTGERTIGYAVSVALPQTEPPDRGFAECCYSNLIFADLGSVESYKNDYNSVFYKRQTPNDTVAYSLIGVSTGTTALVNNTHGILYAFGTTEQPDLSYFTVEWRKILSLLGEDTYTIRKTLSIAGVAFVVDSNSFVLRQFNVDLADKTTRIDCKLDGKLVKIDTDFKNTNYTNSLRIQGFSGNRKANFEQDNVVYSSKNGLPFYEDQITMSNVYDYNFVAYQIPECISRILYDEILFGNELFLNDYNKNNHSYLYNRTKVILSEDNGLEYNALGRGVNVSLKFTDRTKDNRKTNC